MELKKVNLNIKRMGLDYQERKEIREYEIQKLMMECQLRGIESVENAGTGGGDGEQHSTRSIDSKDEKQ